MKNLFSLLAVLSIGSNLAVHAQQQSTIKVGNPGLQLQAPTTIKPPVKNDPPAIILPGKGTLPPSQPADAKPLSAAAVAARIQDQKRIIDKIEKRIEFEHSKGIINVNFGIVQQGSFIKVFCPFNIKTLESKATIFTSILAPGSFERYSLWNNPSAITYVGTLYGPISSRYTGGATGSGVGNGFSVIYSPTTQLGAVDEMVTVFTKQGNITYRITGYVYAKDGETTVSK